MNNIPNLNDMLKLYTKKDLWGRIQHHIKRIDNLQQQLDQANEDKMWLNVEIDTLKSEKENLMRTLEESAERIREQDTRWQKLKEWLRRAGPGYMDDGLFDCAGAIYEVIDKMQDLEKGEKE